MALEPWLGPICSLCGLPLPVAAPPDSGPVLCPSCRIGEFDFDLARSYGLYSGALRGAVLQLKFRQRERLGRKLGELLAGAWTSLGGALDAPILVPVPLHPARQRERGYNQAELLAEGLVRRIRKEGKPTAFRIEKRCLKRVKATAPQTGLSLHARRENVRGVFSVTSPELTRGRSVVLVDDVMTTGATLSACASALKEAGAERVLALTVARATPQFPDTASNPGSFETIDDFGG